MPEEIFTVHVNSDDLYKTGHMVNRWFRRLAGRLEDDVRAAAPMRSGDLKAGIRGRVDADPSQHHMTLNLEFNAPYSLYVLRGTTGPIFTKKGWETGIGNGKSFILVPGKYGFMQQNQPGYWMRFGGWGYPWVWKDAVAGQKQNNFLLTGWRKTASHHRAMARVPSFVWNP